MNKNNITGPVVRPYREGFTTHEVTYDSRFQFVVTFTV